MTEVMYKMNDRWDEQLEMTGDSKLLKMFPQLNRQYCKDIRQDGTLLEGKIM